MMDMVHVLKIVMIIVIIINNYHKELYPQKFNVLIADCEGCLKEFLFE